VQFVAVCVGTLTMIKLVYQMFVSAHCLIAAQYVWCSVVQCVAVCCSACWDFDDYQVGVSDLVDCSVMQCVAVCCSVWCSVLQFVAVCVGTLTIIKLVCFLFQRTASLPQSSCGVVYVAVCCSLLLCVLGF